MSVKTAYVGSREGELTIMVTPTGFIVTIDLSIPQAPAFILKVPFDHDPSAKDQMFDEMITMLQVELVDYLLSRGMEQSMVDDLYHAMGKAIDKAGGGDENKSDRSGVGGDTLLERIVELEPLEVFEVRWQLPEGFEAAVHQRIVTAAATDSQAFKSWFSGSKVVDAQGHPLRCFHGTPHDFDQFKEGSGYGIWFATESTLDEAEIAMMDEASMSGIPLIPSPNPDVGPSYPEGGRIIPVYVCLKDPAELTGGFEEGDLTAAGHDGGVYRDASGAINCVVALRSSQVKSAIGNSGAFDPNDHRITARLFTRQAFQQKVTLPEHGATAKLPGNFQHNPGPNTLTQNYPSVRNLVRKFRSQQGKNLTGPAFVMVYDVNGRPIGVRSIKGPNWGWVKKAGRPSLQELINAGLELRAWLKQNIDPHTQMKQSGGGTVYIVFFGPKSHQQRKVRISDHEKPTYYNPALQAERWSDFDLVPGVKSTVEEAKAWSRTASLFQRKVALRDVYPLKSAWSPENPDVEVYINPSRGELKAVQSKDGCARGFLTADGTKLFIWKAGDGLHGEMAPYLDLHGINREEIIPLTLWPGGSVSVTDASRRTKWFHNPAVVPAIQDAAALRTALGNHPVVHFFDEDIVGDWAEL